MKKKLMRHIRKAKAQISIVITAKSLGFCKIHVNIKYDLSTHQKSKCCAYWNLLLGLYRIPKACFLSPAENKFDLELSSKVFFFTELCSLDIAFEESE